MQRVGNERIRAKTLAKPAEAGAQPCAASPNAAGRTERKRLSLKFGG